MKYNKFAATGAATALAVGALVGATATSAQAAAGTSTYSCVTALGTFTVPTTVDLADLPDTLMAGQVVAGGLGAPLLFSSGPDLGGALSGLGLKGLTSPDFALPFGDSSAPVSGIAMSGLPTPNAGGGLDLPASGATEEFRAPAAGRQDITTPAAFTLAVDTDAFGLVNVPCTTAAPVVLDSVEVLKNDSTTSGKATKRSFQRGTVAKIKSTVVGESITPSGRVEAVRGSKTYAANLNDAGVAVIKLGKNLKPGTYEFDLRYLGSGYHNASDASTPVKVKVVNP